MNVDAERLAYWYLRLNGFLMIPGFVVHPDRGGNQETDVDIIGVRFPYRVENVVRPMKDEERFTSVGEKTFVALVEVKTGEMRLNGPWTNQDRGNMSRVLSAIGPMGREECRSAALALYKSGSYRSQLYHISLVCIGSRVNMGLRDTHPAVEQITWPQVKQFIYERFRAYRREKSSHKQWDEDGRNLWDLAETSRSYEKFDSEVHITG